jgi:hypothetical protein
VWLTVPRRGGWRVWGAVRADFERARADPVDPAIASAEIASELRRGADYVRVTVALTAAATDVANAPAIAWDAFRAAAGDDLSGWEAAAAAQVQQMTPIWKIRLTDQRTTRTVLPGRRAPLPLSKACRPSASGKVWLITPRSRPVPAISASLASSPASGSTTKNIAWTLYLPASSWSGGAPRVTSRPPSRSRP